MEKAVLNFTVNYETLKALNKELERSADLLSKLSKKSGSDTSALEKEIEKLKKAYDSLSKSSESQAKAQAEQAKKGVGNIAEMRDELKKLKKQYEQNYSAESDSVAADETLKRIQALNTEIGKVSKSYRGQRKALNVAEDSIEGMKARLNELRDEYGRLSAAQQSSERGQAIAEEARQLDSAVKAQKKALRGLATESEMVEGSYRDLNRQLKDARAEFKELSRAGREGMKGQKLLSDIKKLDKELKDLDEEMGQFQRNVGNYKSALGGLGDVMGGLAGGKGGVVSMIGSAGVWGAAAAGAIELASAVGEAVQEYDRLSGKIQQLAGFEGRELANVTGDIEGIAKTYGAEVDEIVQATNALSKAKGISFTDALRKVEEGFNAGANSAGEYLDSLREYSVQAELTSDELNEILAVSAEEGIYADKLVDSVKEFDLRIKEQTKATREALEGAFGTAFTQDIFDAVNSGAMTSMEALRKVSEGLNDTGLTAQQTQTVIADVFGGPGEDAGIRALRLLKDIDGNLKDVDATASETSKAQKRRMEAEQEAARARNQLLEQLKPLFREAQIFWAKLQTALIKGLRLLKNPLRLVVNQVKLFYNGVKAFLTLDLMGIARAFVSWGEEIISVFADMYDSAAAFFGYVTERRKEQSMDWYAKEADRAIKEMEERARKAREKEITDRAAHLRKLAKQRGKILSEQAAKERANLEASREGLYVTELKWDSDKARAKAREDTDVFLKQLKRVEKAQEDAVDVKPIDLASLSYKELRARVEELKVSLAETPDELITGEQLEKIDKAEKALDKLQEAIDMRNRTPIELVTEPSALDTSGVEITDEDGPTLPLQLDEISTEIKPIWERDWYKEGMPEPEELRDMAIDAAMQVGDAVFSIAQSNSERRLEMEKQNIDRQYQAEVEAARGNQVLIAQAEEEKQKAIIRAEQKAAKRKKRIAIAEAIVNAASAAVNVMASSPPFAWPVLLPFVALQTAAQIATISAQQFKSGGAVPEEFGNGGHVYDSNQFGRGGSVEGNRADIFRRGGMLRGKSHAFGGVPFTNGRQQLEAEGGEFIVNAKSSKLFRGELERINEIGNRYERGGFVSSERPSYTAIGMHASDNQRDNQRLALLEKAVMKIADQKVVQSLETLDEDQSERSRFKRVSNID